MLKSLKGYRKKTLAALALVQPLAAYIGWNIDPQLITEWVANHKTSSLVFQGIASYLIHHFDSEDKKKMESIKSDLKATKQDVEMKKNNETFDDEEAVTLMIDDLELELDELTEQEIGK
ncbi:MAG: hypothetical protein ACRBHB_18215 [Arenicella sp.]